MNAELLESTEKVKKLAKEAIPTAQKELKEATEEEARTRDALQGLVNEAFGLLGDATPADRDEPQPQQRQAHEQQAQEMHQQQLQQ